MRAHVSLEEWKMCAIRNGGTKRKGRDWTDWGEREREIERDERILYRIYSTEMKIPFAVRYIKLVVECFESYHSHFDELGPQNRSSRTVCVGVSLRSNMLNARLINNQPLYDAR